MSDDPAAPDAPEGEGGPGKLLAGYEAHAPRFSFYRLVYLLQRLYPESPRLGHTGPARDERIRLRVDPSLVFSTSDVTNLKHNKDADGEKRVKVQTAFLGLFGSVSPPAVKSARLSYATASSGAFARSFAASRIVADCGRWTSWSI